MRTITGKSRRATLSIASAVALLVFSEAGQAADGDASVGSAITEKAEKTDGTVSLPTRNNRATANCIKPGELHADKIRFIQTQMMVAALQCRKYDDGAMPKLYNNYIQVNRTVLKQGQKQITSFLKRERRGNFAGYLTELANRVSLASLDMPNFCGRMKVAVSQSLSLDDPVNALPIMPVSYQVPKQICLTGKPKTIEPVIDLTPCS